jgi:hypothetical protein
LKSRHLESGAKTEARRVLEVSVRWVGPSSRGLWGGHALLLSTRCWHRKTPALNQVSPWRNADWRCICPPAPWRCSSHPRLRHMRSPPPCQRAVPTHALLAERESPASLGDRRALQRGAATHWPGHVPSRPWSRSVSNSFCQRGVSEPSSSASSHSDSNHPSFPTAASATLPLPTRLRTTSTLAAARVQCGRTVRMGATVGGATVRVRVATVVRGRGRSAAPM